MQTSTQVYTEIFLWTETNNDLQDEEKCVSIEISELVELQFACKYLSLFTKVVVDH